MKKMLILFASLLLAYDAKVEPYEVYNIKAAASGEVVIAKKELESKVISNSLVIKLDDTKEKITLKNLNTQIELLKNQIKNQQEVVNRKYEIYKRYKNLRTKSQEQKDMKFFDYINAKNALLNLKTQLSNLISQRDSTLDTINKKNIKLSGYLYKINVTPGDFVTNGMLVAQVDDISKQKLTIYVPIDKIEEIQNKTIYINDKPSDFKIQKIWIVPDSKYVTSYRVDLVGSGLKFGDIVKVDFR